MKTRLLLSAAVVFLGAVELNATPSLEMAPAAAGGCNTPMPFPCFYPDPHDPEWEIRAMCDMICPEWVAATCITTALTCYSNIS